MKVSPYHLMHPLPPFACRRFPLNRCRLQVGVQEVGHSPCMMKGPHNGAEDRLLMCHSAHHHQKDVTHLYTVPHLCHRFIPLHLHLHLQHVLYLCLNMVLIYSLLSFHLRVKCFLNLCLIVVAGASSSSNAPFCHIHNIS